MRWAYSLPLRLRSLFRRDTVEQELNEELASHLAQKTDAYLAEGLTPEEARRAALRDMDGFTQKKEECRDMRRMNPIDDAVRDIRYSLRVLARSPAFSVVAVLTLALAIGANAVVFAILNTMVLRPLNVPRPESLYALEHGRGKSLALSYPDFVDLRDHNHTFDGLAAYNNSLAALDTGSSPVRAFVDEVSGNYFDVFGLRPYLGRFFRASEEHGPGSAPYIVLTYAYWDSHFHADRGVIGRTVQLNKHPFVIIGVAPPGFHGPVLFFGEDLFVPIVSQKEIEGQYTLDDRGARPLLMTVGHLKPGITPRQAIADLNSIGSYLEKTWPKTEAGMTFALTRSTLFGDQAGAGTQAFLGALMLLAGLILLAACANLGNLFAARAADRGREIALRLALGARTNRVLRALFTEALLISILGGALGLWAGQMVLSVLSAWRPVPKYPVQMTVTADARVYGVALLLALLSGLLFGAVPIRQVLGTDPWQIVRSAFGSRHGRRIAFRDALLVVQIAICAVLVTSSYVAVRGLLRSMHSHFGFEPANAMLMDTDLTMAGYRGDEVPAMQKRMIAAMQAIPGVVSVGLIDLTPLGGSMDYVPVYRADAADLRPAAALTWPASYSCSPEYFRAASTALLYGRGFTWHDDRNAPLVAVVNAEFARRMFGSVSDALSNHFKLRDGTSVQVVGIVENGKYETITEDRSPAMFLPILQRPSSSATLVVRANLDPRQLAAAMKTKLRQLDSGLPSLIQSWDGAMGPSMFAARMATIALGVLGIIGAMLAVTGTFGVAAHSLSRRLKELGIRMALGARRRQVLEAALGRALKLLAFGSAAGLVLGILASQVLASIVYSATPRDPLVMAGAVITMALVGLLATWIPAQRALSLDPASLLREE